MRELINILDETELLSEALMSAKEWNKEKYWTLFVENLRAGQTLFNFKLKTPDLVPGTIINADEVAEKIEHAFTGKFTPATRIELLKSITIKAIELDDTDEPIPGKEFVARLTQISKDEKITGALKPNMGDIAEAVLGCAVTAKFEKRGATITVDDAIEVGRRIADAGGAITGITGKDQLYFKVSIPAISKKAFYAFLGKDPKGKTLSDYNIPADKVEKFSSYLTSAVEYANTSKRVFAAIEKAQADKRKNKVDVISDGGEKANQSITKVDLKVLVDGTSINLLSIKAGAVSQFGQVAGYNFNHLNEFFSSTVGLPLSDTVKKKFVDVPKGMRGEEALKLKMKNYLGGFKTAYNEIFKQLNAMSKNDPASLIRRVFRGTMFHLTRGEDGVEMVILEPSAKKAFSELSFGPEFRKALSQLQLFVEEDHKPLDYYIHIYGIPKTELARKVFKRGEKLLTLRSRIEDKVNFRNVIGMGPLLKDIADIEKIIQKSVVPAKTVAPVAKQPATAPVVPTRVAKQTAPVAQSPVTPNLKMDEPVQAKPRPQRTVVQPARPRR
jgi:hypothetical protein